MDLKPVKLLKTDTCLTYAFKRIGKSNLIDDVSYDNIHDFFESSVYRKNKKLNIGDILYWNRDSKFVDLPWEIDINGKILWHRKIINSHVAVYEGDDIISDNTRFVQPPHPTLRVRKLSQLNKMPDYILKFIEIHNE